MGSLLSTILIKPALLPCSYVIDCTTDFFLHAVNLNVLGINTVIDVSQNITNKNQFSRLLSGTAQEDHFDAKVHQRNVCKII